MNVVPLPTIYRYYCRTTGHKSDTTPCVCDACIKRQRKQDPLRDTFHKFAVKKSRKTLDFIPALCDALEQEIERQLTTDNDVLFDIVISFCDFQSSDPGTIYVGTEEFGFEEWDNFALDCTNMSFIDRTNVYTHVYTKIQKEWNRRHPLMEMVPHKRYGQFIVIWK